MNANHTAWCISQNVAAIEHESVTCEVHFARPDSGITNLRVGGVLHEGLHILGVDLKRWSEDDMPPLADVWVRGGDLVATYEQTAQRPFRVQVYWRLREATSAACTFDLEVSVQTSLLDILAQLTSSSRLPPCALLRPTHGTEFVPIDLGVECRQELTPQAGPGIVVARFDDSPWSYAEMTHPIDFRRDLVSQAAADGADAGTLLRHWLFAADLEKGVILRARVRGAFVPRAHDVSCATREYGRFVDAPLPLTT